MEFILHHLSLIRSFSIYTHLLQHKQLEVTTISGCKTTLTEMLSSPIIPIAILVTIATILRLVLLNYKRGTSEKRVIGSLPPGPVTSPVIGNMHQLIWSKPAVFRWIHGLLKEMGTDILCLRLGATPVVVVACPQIAREVLRKKDAMFTARPPTFASNLFSYGYKSASLTTVDYQWKKMKRILTSEILSPALEHKLHDQRVAEADHLIRYVYSQINITHESNINVRHVAQYFCGNIIRRLVFGKRYFGEPPAMSVGGPGHQEVEHVDALFTLLNYVYGFCVSDYFPALVGLDLDGHEKVAKRVVSTLDRLHDPIIQERMQEWSSHPKSGDKRDVTDFLDVLIKAQIVEIMFATVDNPSNAVEWALAEMMNKPDIMQKAMDELNAVVGTERLVQESDLYKLNYLKACIREAFRIHPYHAFTAPRVAMEDTTIAGYMIPKGSQVILSRIGLGQNSKVWIEPLEFRPERHLNNDDPVALSEPDLRFISFSTGRRGCPGASLGTSITMMLFARLLQGFTWSKPSNIDRINLHESNASLALAEPLVLEAKPRLAAHLYAAK
ncbi:hypothetical protein ACP70R_011690 [Stipagrostis hirtigluma subsp. patula]